MNLIEVMKQALEALEESVLHQSKYATTCIRKHKEAINNLCAAIEAAKKSSQAGFVSGGVKELGDFRPLSYTSTPIPEKQKPVAEVYRHGKDSHGREWHGIHWYDPNLDVPTGTKLYTQPAHAVSEGWIRAIDEAMVCSHLGVANASDTYEEAKKKLNSLICWNIDVATDPAVNGDWQLVPKEPTDAMLAAYNKVSEWLDSNKGTRYKIQAAYDKALGEPHYKAMLASAPKFGEKE